MSNISKISKISEINLSPSMLYLFWTYTVCCKAIRNESTDFNVATEAYEKIFRLVFIDEVGLHFLINLLCLLFFSQKPSSFSMMKWFENRIF